MSQTVTLGLAGDTMLGRMVAEALASAPPEDLFSAEVLGVAHEADLFVLNLECCISDRGERWPDPAKPFFFRAPPEAVEALLLLGVDCVTLANNHALDFREAALLDTLDHLGAAGISCVGAGPDVSSARKSAVIEARSFRVGVIGFTDHPADFAATESRPGVAYTDLRKGLPGWIGEAISGLDTDAILVTPHWGPNMTPRPVARVRNTAAELETTDATLIAGHSAHVFHGVAGRVLYDLGDFIDDYAVDPLLRNDLGLLWLVTLDHEGPRRMEAVPLALDYCHTRLANSEETAWITQRFRSACQALGTQVEQVDGRLVVSWNRDG